MLARAESTREGKLQEEVAITGIHALMHRADPRAAPPQRQNPTQTLKNAHLGMDGPGYPGRVLRFGTPTTRARDIRQGAALREDTQNYAMSGCKITLTLTKRAWEGLTQ